MTFLWKLALFIHFSCHRRILPRFLTFARLYSRLPRPAGSQWPRSPGSAPEAELLAATHG